MYNYLFDFLHHMKFNHCHKLTEQEQHRNFEGASDTTQQNLREQHFQHASNRASRITLNHQVKFIHLNSSL